MLYPEIGWILGILITGELKSWKFSRTGVRRVEKSLDFDIGQEDEICECLKYLFGSFYEAEAKNESSDDAVFKSFGFSLEKKTSSIKGAGDGLFVSRGVIHKNSIAAMYPGLDFMFWLSTFKLCKQVLFLLYLSVSYGLTLKCHMILKY